MFVCQFGGLKIVTDETMVNYSATEIKMTIWERIITLSFFKKTKTIIKIEPKTEVVHFGDNLIMHPSVFEELKKDKRFKKASK